MLAEWRELVAGVARDCDARTLLNCVAVAAAAAAAGVESTPATMITIVRRHQQQPGSSSHGAPPATPSLSESDATLQHSSASLSYFGQVSLSSRSFIATLSCRNARMCTQQP